MVYTMNLKRNNHHYILKQLK